MARLMREEGYMSGEKVTVVALVKAKEGMGDRVRKELLTLIDPTRSEEGCIDYDLHEAIDDPSVFVFFENWRSMKDLERHRETAHIRSYRKNVGELLAEPIQVILLKKIA
jgi:quinol monooxygenase YgiN